MTPWSEVEDYDCGKWVKNSIEETSKAMKKLEKKKMKKTLKN